MILVTGGAGYIGSHTLISLHEAGYEFVVFDNLSNSSKESLNRVSKIIKKDIIFEEGDIRDSVSLERVFKKYTIDAVIHFAGLKSVGESVVNPLEYYDNNVNGTLVLLSVMQKYYCYQIVFSSSATVYNEIDSDDYKALEENDPIGNTTNPYGTSKYMIERILQDLYISNNNFKIVILRYFNPVGADSSGTIGEDPKGIPNNLMSFISQVAVGKRASLNVFGGDYNTSDGTGVRDYIHVEDLALGHLKALDKISTIEEPLIVNLGTGKGYTVLEIIKYFKKASNKQIEYKIVERRAGDIAKCYANPRYAQDILGWSATKTIDDMCRDSWRWQMNNPEGYEKLKDKKRK